VFNSQYAGGQGEWRERYREVISNPVRRISKMPAWYEQGPAMLRWLDESTPAAQWREESVPARRFDASDEWDDKWLRPLFVTIPSDVPPSQPAKAQSAPEKCVVEAPVKRADASTEGDAKWLRPEPPALLSSPVGPPEPAKTGNFSQSIEPKALPLQLRFLRWLFDANQCQATRYSTPDLIAYYFTGGATRSFQVGNMSVTGLYLRTKERWAPGTLIRMTLQKKNRKGGTSKDSICVLSELVRSDQKGAGFNFVLPDYKYLRAYGLRPEEMLDPKLIERFIQKTGFGPVKP